MIGRRLCPGMAAHLLWWLALVDASRGFCFLPRLLDADHRLPKAYLLMRLLTNFPKGANGYLL